MNKQYTVMTAIVGIAIMGSILAISNVSTAQSSTFAVAETTSTLGHVTIAVVDEDGFVKAYRQTDNDVVNLGEDCIAATLFGLGTVCGTATTELMDFDDIRIGTGASATTDGQTALQTTTDSETDGLTTLTNTEASLTDDTVTATTTDIMFARDTFSAVTLGASDDLVVTWTITIGS